MDVRDLTRVSDLQFLAGSERHLVEWFNYANITCGSLPMLSPPGDRRYRYSTVKNLFHG